MNNRIQTILNKLSELVTTLTNKQDKLVGSGTGQNVKTINEQNILGTGNINIEGFSGDYDDLTNKPELPTGMTEQDIDDALDEGDTLAEQIRSQAEEEIDNGTY